MNEVKISVIIPIYNCEDYIKQCLDSIKDQSLNDIEIICIDDASTDNSLEIINNFSKKDKRIKCIRQSKNCGAGPARNRGLELARGEYISFVDSDDFIIDNKAYEKLYEIATTNYADVVSANMKVYNNDKLEKNSFIKDINSNSQINPEDYGIPWYFQKNLYKKQFLEEKNIKFPDYRSGEDPVFLAKVLKDVNIIYGLPIDFYIYRSSPHAKINSEEKEIDYIEHFKDVFDILDFSKFQKTVLEYEKIMYNFFNEYTFTFQSKSLNKNIKDIFKDDTKTLMIYELNCSLWEKNNEIQKLKRTLSKKEKIIQDIMLSNSWKLTKFLRKMGLWLRNPIKNKPLNQDTKISK